MKRREEEEQEEEDEEARGPGGKNNATLVIRLGTAHPALPQYSCEHTGCDSSQLDLASARKVENKCARS